MVGGQPGFFRSAAGPRGGQPRPPGRGIGALFAELIRAGHRAGDLPHYTARQIRLYAREARRLECEARAAAIVDCNAAVWGDAAGQVKRLLGEED